jgi:hypothetical protein
VTSKTNSKKALTTKASAGRPKVYNLMELMAIYLRVEEVMKQHNLKYKTEAIRLLQSTGELPMEPGVNFGRYLTPKYLFSKIAKALKNAPARTGLVSLIPLPRADRKIKK